MSYSNIYLGNNTSQGRIKYNFSNNNLTIENNGHESLNITEEGHILPGLDTTYDLGTTTARFRDLYLSGDSIILGDTVLNASGGELRVDGAATGVWNENGSNIYFDTGNVGVGTNSPSTNLHIYDSSNTSNNLLRLENADSGTAATTRLQINNDDAAILVLESFSTGYTTSGSAIADGARVRSSSSAHGGLALDATLSDMTFWTNSTERMVIKNGGNVGIGTTNPSNNLHVAGSSGTLVRLTDTTSGTDATLLMTGNPNSFIRMFSSTNNINSIIGNDSANDVMRVYCNDTGGTSITGNTDLGIFIKPNGDVGIGTNSPGGKFHLHENSSGECFLDFTNTTTGNGNFVGGRIGLLDSEVFEIVNFSNTNMNFYVNGGTRMSILPTGPVQFSEDGAIFGTSQQGSLGINPVTTFGTIMGVNYNPANGTHIANGIAMLMDINSNTGFIRFNTSNENAGVAVDQTELMRITSSGNLGIGTDSPESLLHLTGGGIFINSGFNNTASRPALTTGSTQAAYEIRAHSSDAITQNDGFLRLRAGGGTNSNTISYIDISGFSTVSDMDVNIVFGTQGVERIRIEEGGFVGIGTNNPSAPLDVQNVVQKVADFNNTQSNEGAYIEVNNQAGTRALFGATGDGFTDAGTYTGVMCGNWSNGYLAFATNASERMRILSNGNVGIGTTNPSGELELFANNPTLIIENNGGAYGGTQNTDIVMRNTSYIQALLRTNQATDGPSGAFKASAEFAVNDNNSLNTIWNVAATDSHFRVNNNCIVGGNLSKGSGSFDIPHPDPVKEEQGYRLKHCFVESPTSGDNIYRYKITTTTDMETYTIELPDYFKHLNGNTQCWATPIGKFNDTYIEEETDEYVKIKCKYAGDFNVIIMGTRKDQVAVDHFSTGVEYIPQPGDDYYVYDEDEN